MPSINYHLSIVPSARKELLALPQSVISRIDPVIMNLAHTPRPHNCIELTGINAYRLRVGDYRIIYDIRDETHQVKILAVGHRREIYR